MRGTFSTMSIGRVAQMDLGHVSSDLRPRIRSCHSGRTSDRAARFLEARQSDDLHRDLARKLRFPRRRLRLAIQIDSSKIRSDGAKSGKRTNVRISSAMLTFLWPCLVRQVGQL